MVTGGKVGRVWLQQVMGIKEGTCDKSLNSAPETNIALYVN